jgi:uncharacterized protein (DUF697 family)
MVTEPRTEADAVLEPSAKEVAALERVRTYMGWSAAGGLIPLPGLDVAAILASQLKMLADIADIYGVPFRRDLGKEAIASLVSAFLPVTVAQASGSLIKSVPVVGMVAAIFWQPALASASTWALGKVFIQHFEAGGTFLDFKPETVREYFREQYEAARAGVAGRPARGTASTTSSASAA